jgi:hypothetical protein
MVDAPEPHARHERGQNNVREHEREKNEEGGAGAAREGM